MLPETPAHPALDVSTRADVCIVGAGFTGLWTALALKRRSPGTDVVLIDGDVCGGGASGRSGGFAMTWWSKFPSLQKLCGADAAIDLCRRSEKAVADIGRFCEEHGIDAWYRRAGWLWAATNTAQLDAWSATLEAIERAGARPFERLERDEVASFRISSAPAGWRAAAATPAGVWRGRRPARSAASGSREGR